jgi:hypothetical protein
MMYQYCKKGAAAVGEPSGRVAAEGPEGPPMVPPPGSRQGAGSKIFQTARFERFAFFYKHVRRRGAAKGPGAGSAVGGRGAGAEDAADEELERLVVWFFFTGVANASPSATRAAGMVDKRLWLLISACGCLLRSSHCARASSPRTWRGSSPAGPLLMSRPPTQSCSAA